MNGNMDESIVEQADDEAGLAGHGGVNGVACETVAENGVLGVGHQAADDVAGVDVADVDGRLTCGKVLAEAVAKEDADVGVEDVAGGVGGSGFAGDEVLAGAFSDNDDSMAILREALFEDSEQTARAFEIEWDFGDQDVIDFAACQGGRGGDEAGVAAH